MKRSVATMALLLMLGACAGFIRDRIYQPAPPTDAPAWTTRAPQPVTVRTADGLTLRGLWWPPVAPERDVVVYFHGNGGSLERDAQRPAALAASGHGVLFATYRGYSGNSGRPTERGLAQDAAAFTALAREKVPAGGRLFLFGHSLGGAVALGEAAARPVDGVATLGTFTRLADMAPGIARPFLPDRYDNLAAIARIAAPVTLFHGDRDDIVPFAQGQALAAASNGRARLVPLPGADHHPDPVRLAPLVWQALQDDARRDAPAVR